MIAKAPPDTDPPRKAESVQGASIGWWLIGLGVVAMVLLWALGAGRESAWAYDRPAILHGEWWRLVSAHWVHWDSRHLLLNLLGVGLITALFLNCYRWWQWVLMATICMVTVGLGLLLLDVDLVRYVGASGVLHGLLAGGAVAWWRTESKGFASILSAILIGKIAWEQLQGSLPLSGEMPVVVNAHLYGSIGGLIAALAIELCWRPTLTRPAKRP
jgi:rhomboid family GlyGly-CTERM serine protease